MSTPAPSLRSGLACEQLALTVAGGLGGTVLFLPRTADVGETPMSGLPFPLRGVSASGVAALVISRRPGNAVGALLAMVGLSVARTMAVGATALFSSGPKTSAALTRPVMWIGTVAGPAGLHLIGVPCLLLSRDGTLPSRRRRWVAITATVALVVSLAGTAFTRGPLPDLPRRVDNPLGVVGPLGRVLPTIGAVAFQAVLVAMLASPLFLSFRYCAAGAQERLQIKWVAYTGGLLILAIIVGNLLAATLISRWEDGASVALVSIGVAAIPTPAGLAIAPYRLCEIDRLISRAFSYTVILATLGAVYAFGTVAVARLLAIGETDWVVAASTLAAAGMFDPVRRRVLRAVDQRFHRAQCEVSQALECFGARLRNEVNLETLRHELPAAATDTVRPAQATVWLVPRRGGRPE